MPDANFVVIPPKTVVKDAVVIFLLSLVVGLAIFAYRSNSQVKSLEAANNKARIQRDAVIDSLQRVSKSYADSANSWRELAKGFDNTVDSLNSVLADLSKKRRKVKHEVKSASDSALIKMFYENLNGR